MILGGFDLISIMYRELELTGVNLSKCSCNRLHSMSNFKTVTKKGRIN